MFYALKNIICKWVHIHHQKVREHPCHKKLKNFDMLVEMYRGVNTNQFQTNFQ